MSDEWKGRLLIAAMGVGVAWWLLPNGILTEIIKTAPFSLICLVAGYFWGRDRGMGEMQSRERMKQIESMESEPR